MENKIRTCKHYKYRKCNNSTQNLCNTVASLTLINSVGSKNNNVVYSSIGSTVVYYIDVINSGYTILNNITIFDILPSELEFVPNSLTLNGVSIPNANLVTGVTIDVLQVTGTKTIKFEAKVISGPGYMAINTVTAKYQYIVNGVTSNGRALSNDTTVFISSGFDIDEDMNLTVKKFIDGSNTYTTIMIGFTMNCTIIIENSGNVKLSNITVQDPLPESLQFVAGSIKVNNIALPNDNPQAGIIIDSLSVNEFVVISFTLKAVTVGTVDNVANAYYYYIPGDGTVYFQSAQSYAVNVTIIPEPSRL